MIRNYLLLVSLACVAACASTTPVDITSTGAQLESRQFQTRRYDTLDMPQTMRSVIATLQDLGFQIEQADAELGTITATRFLTVNKRYQVQMMRMTITVAEREGAQVSVRANARVGERSVDDAETYQDFFVALDKAMFLTAQRVD